TQPACPTGCSRPTALLGRPHTCSESRLFPFTPHICPSGVCIWNWPLGKRGKGTVIITPARLPSTPAVWLSPGLLSRRAPAARCLLALQGGSPYDRHIHCLSTTAGPSRDARHGHRHGRCAERRADEEPAARRGAVHANGALAGAFS